MKTLAIDSLRLKNFKGITDLDIDFDCQDMSISGENASGKTTLIDAIYWLLFNKDSHGKADFQLKPIISVPINDPESYADNDEYIEAVKKHNKQKMKEFEYKYQEAHNLDTDVEGSFFLNGESKVLRKRFQEKYTKKRGSATKDFTGHTTDYFVDGVPVKQKEYQATIDEIIDISTFRIVTNPFEFNNIHWTDRRGILLDMCGGTSDQDKLKKNELEKKKIQAKQKDINKEIEQIPIRIDELTASIKDVPAMNGKDKKRLEDEIHGLRNKLQALVMNEEESLLEIRVNEIDSEVLKVDREAYAEYEKEAKPLLKKEKYLEKEKRAVEKTITDVNDEMPGFELAIKKLNIEAESLRTEWVKVDTGAMDNIEACPACGQDLPQEHIDKTLEKFNLYKASELERINTEGKDIVLEIGKYEKETNDSKSALKTFQTDITGIEVKIKANSKELDELEVADNTIELKKEKTRIEKEIKALSQDSAPAIKVLNFNVKEKEADLKKWNEGQAAFESAEKSRERIEELGESEKALAGEYEKLEEKLFEIENFIVEAVKLIEDSLNDKFKLARFKLFKKQINGGIEECCEVTSGGVPFNYGLNNAARINTGLDIINTMSEYYKFRAPIFCDNSEAVNEIIDIDTQVIKLYVSNDEKLVFEK